MSGWSHENSLKAFEYGFNIPAHKIQLGQESEHVVNNRSCVELYQWSRKSPLGACFAAR